MDRTGRVVHFLKLLVLIVTPLFPRFLIIHLFVIVPVLGLLLPDELLKGVVTFTLGVEAAASLLVHAAHVLFEHLAGTIVLLLIILCVSLGVLRPFVAFAIPVSRLLCVLGPSAEWVLIRGLIPSLTWETLAL